MKKRILVITSVAIISEIIALGVVLSLLSYFLGDKTVAEASCETRTCCENFNCTHDNYDGDFYNIKSYISLSERAVIIKESIKLGYSDKNNGQINKINSINDINDISKKVYLYIPSLNITDTTIKNIFFEEEKFNTIAINDWEIRGLVLEIPIVFNEIRDDETQNKNSVDKTFYIHIEYEINLDKKIGTIAKSKNKIFLTNFLITPAVFKDGEPIFIETSPFGDPYMYECNNYYTVFYINNNMEVFAPGEKKTLSNEDITSNNMVVETKTIVFTALNIRDFPAVIINQEEVSHNKNSIHVEKINNTDIYFINSIETKDYVKESFLFAWEKIGPYPYDKLFVVNAPMQLKGMEFSNMIFVSEDCINNKEGLRSLVYHEIFHQWFYGIIGTDQINEPYMDEGIVNYLAIMLDKNTINEKYDNGFFNLSLKDYVSKDDYYRLVYLDAAKYFFTIHKNLGDEFYRLLGKIYDEKKYEILYFNEFEQYLSGFLEQGG
jgi:hypothetical protein